KQAFAGPGPNRQAPDPQAVAQAVEKARSGKPLTPEEQNVLMAQVAYGARVAMWQMHLKFGGDMYKNIYAPEHIAGWCGQGQAASAYYTEMMIPGAKVHPL